MERTSIEKLNAIKNILKQSGNREEKSIEQIREKLSANVSRLPKLPGVVTNRVHIGHLDGEWIKEESVVKDEEKVILYFHGGGFISGSCDSHRDLAARISKSSGVQVLLIEYRLAPEHKYPVANEDCLFAYEWLIKNGFAPGNIILGGDSVGGTLVLMTLLFLRDKYHKLPIAAFLLSPHTDLLNLDGESYISRAEVDSMVRVKDIQWMTDCYLGPIDQKPSVLSPLKYNFKGFPSLFIQVGDHEIILSDSIRLSQYAKEAGVDVTLEIWDNMWHVFQSMAFMLPEAQQAIDNIGNYVKRQFENSSNQ